MFDRIKAKEKSKTLIRTRSFFDSFGMVWILVILLASVFLLLVSNLFNVGLSALLSYLIPAGVVVQIILMAIIAIGIATAVLSVVSLFHAGMNRAALRINRGDKNVRVIDVALAGDCLSRYLAISLWQILFIFLWNFPSIVATLIALLLMIKGSGTGASIACAVILVIAAGVWSIFITLNKFCQYFYAYCIAEDHRDMRALDCVHKSSDLMIDHKWELFVTMLSFLGWDFLGANIIGAIFVIPYQYLTYTSIYEQLIGNFKPVHDDQMLWLHNKPTLKSSNVAQDSGERMIQFLSGEFTGTSIPVTPGKDITIGRDSNRANVVTSSANTTISGLHCRIRYDEQNGKYIVIDYSTNGTYLNNEKLTPERVNYALQGSLVTLADGAMIFKLS